MRLIDCRSDPLRMQNFNGRPPHPFAILSHTWDGHEVSFQDFANEDTRTTQIGWDKIQGTCDEALACGLSYVWIDSCCIDKTNYTELTESINSMFQWYNDAALCLVYLSDFNSTIDALTHSSKSRWFSRGWTLQELVAARKISFYDASWRFFGTRKSLSQELVDITKIDEEILDPPEDADVRALLNAIPVARRMSWAASRSTTKPEDVAYCLLGMFGVSLPMLYGEGAHQAFIRLQEAIIHESNDLSVFAWTSQGSNQPYDLQEERSNLAAYRGILARSPAEFAGQSRLISDHEIKFNPHYSMSNKGLQIHSRLYPLGDSDDVIMPLHCHFIGYSGNQLGIYLKHYGADVYVRIYTDSLAMIQQPTSSSDERSIFISKRIQPRNDALLKQDVVIAHTIQAIEFRVSKKSKLSFRSKILDAKPERIWDTQSYAQSSSLTTVGLQNFTAFIKYAIYAGKIGQVVVACGVTTAGAVWVAVDSISTQLGQASLVKDDQTMSRVGSQRMMQNHHGHKEIVTWLKDSDDWDEWAVVKWSWERQVETGRSIVVVNLDFQKVPEWRTKRSFHYERAWH